MHFSPERMSVRRRRLGKTQVSLSREIGLSQVSISALEKGKKEPRANTLAKLARALECPTDYFFV